MNSRFGILIGGLALAWALAGCADAGKTQESDTAPPLNVNQVNVQVVSASVPASGKPVVQFKLVDGSGNSVDSVTLGSDPSNANIGVTIAQLVPASGGNASYWFNYLITTEVKTAAKPGTAANGNTSPQSATEGTQSFPAGSLSYDKSSATYTYSFGTNITTIIPPAGTSQALTVPNGNPLIAQYDATKTHRIGIELRQVRVAGQPLTGSGVFDFVPAGGTPTKREIVAASTCNGACHGQVEGHNGTRTSPDYCAVCHNPNHYDGNTGNSLDLKVMAHRIHMGRLMPSKFAVGTDYLLYGSNDIPRTRSLDTMPHMTGSRSTTSVVGLNPTPYPYDPLHLGNENFVSGAATTNGGRTVAVANGKNAINGAGVITPLAGNYFPDCTQCHVSGASAQDTNWTAVPTQQACGSCHDNIDFVNAAPAAPMLPHAAGAGLASSITDNSACATCHNSQTSFGAGVVDATHVAVDTAHNAPVLLKAQSARFGWGFDSVTYNAATGAASVTFHVTKDGANIDFTDFTTNPEWNPTAVTPGSTVPATLTAACTTPPDGGAQGFGWTSLTPANCAALTAPGTAGALTLVVGWSATEHRNTIGLGYSKNLTAASAFTYTLMGTSNIVRVTKNGVCPACTFTATLPVNLPFAKVASEGNTIVTGMYGRPGVLIGSGISGAKQSFDGNTANYPVRGALPKAATAYFDVAGGNGAIQIAPMGSGDSRIRRVVVDANKCNTCHDTLNLHGSRNANPQLCVICHNTNNTDVIASSRTPANALNAPVSFGSDGQREQAVDFKYLIHGIHAGGQTYAQFPTPTTILEGFRSRGLTVSGSEFSFVNFPNKLSNCRACHVDPPSGGRDTFALPMPSFVKPTTVTTIPPFGSATQYPNGPQTQWEASRHTIGAGAMTQPGGASNPILFTMAGHTYQNSTLAGSTGMPVSIAITIGSGATLPTGYSEGTPYYIVNSAAGTFNLAASPGGPPVPCPAVCTAATGGPYGGSPFTIAPYALNDASDDWNTSPTAAACSACHYDDNAKLHMVNTGGAVIDFPAPSATGITGIVLTPSLLTDQNYVDVQAARNGPGYETCAGCHGPGGQADVRVMHKLP